jgi:hypothetical protein
MTTPTIPSAREVQDQVRTAVRKGQQATLEAIKSVADTMSSVAPRIPAAASGLAGKLPTSEAVMAKAYDLAGQALAEQRKLAGKLPIQEATVTRVFDFADAFLADRRKFAEQALQATAALRPAAKPADQAADQAAGEAPAETPGE